jgi:hypothetical protein
MQSPRVEPYGGAVHGGAPYGMESGMTLSLPLSTSHPKDRMMKGHPLQEAPSMSQTIRQTIAELETRAKQYEVGAAKSRQAAQQLRELLQLDGPTGSSVKASAPPAAKKPSSQAKPQPKAAPVKKTKSSAKPKTKSVAKSSGKPTLKAAIAHVLETRQQKDAGGVKATQLYEEIHDAGYRFSGTNKKNNMTYLYKILRQNKSRFANAEGLFSLKG